MEGQTHVVSVPGARVLVMAHEVRGAEGQGVCSLHSTQRREDIIGFSAEE